jgi:hypothetical protein
MSAVEPFACSENGWVWKQNDEVRGPREGRAEEHMPLVPQCRPRGNVLPESKL